MLETSWREEERWVPGTGTKARSREKGWLLQEPHVVPCGWCVGGVATGDKGWGPVMDDREQQMTDLRFIPQGRTLKPSSLHTQKNDSIPTHIGR